MLLSEAKQILKKNGYRLTESDANEERFIKQVINFLNKDRTFTKMFGLDEIKELCDKYYDGLIEFMDGSEAAAAAAANWLTEIAYEDDDFIV